MVTGMSWPEQDPCGIKDVGPSYADCETQGDGAERAEGNACDDRTIKQVITQTHGSLPHAETWSPVRLLCWLESNCIKTNESGCCCRVLGDIAGGAVTSCPNLPGSSIFSPWTDSCIYRWGLGFSFPFPF